MRSDQQPTSRPGYLGDVVYEHPAFGAIGAARTSWSGGGTTLHGTDFKHANTVRITVHTAELVRGLHHDGHHTRRRVLELEMSESQWASFVSSMNVGDGVPCTIRSIEGEEMPGIPFRQQVTEFESEMKGDALKMASRVKDAIEAVEGEIGSSLSNKRRDAILSHLRRLHQDLTANLPFLVKTFGRHMEDTVDKAKVEVNAYVLSAVQRAGLQALGGDTALLALEEGATGPETAGGGMDVGEGAPDGPRGSSGQPDRGEEAL